MNLLEITVYSFNIRLCRVVIVRLQWFIFVFLYFRQFQESAICSTIHDKSFFKGEILRFFGDPSLENHFCNRNVLVDDLRMGIQVVVDLSTCPFC